jgi:mannose-6-phosphate isomerase-like protein (cupin superfamily)
VKTELVPIYINTIQMETLTENSAVIHASQVLYQVFGALAVGQYINVPELPNLSLSVVVIDGMNETACNDDFDSIYFVTAGTGIFEIEGEAWPVWTGSMVMIRRSVHYLDYGKFTAVVANSPRFHK